MVKKLFTWNDWDVVEDDVDQYYGCTLRVPIGDHAIGDVIPIIAINHEVGVLSIYMDPGVEEAHRIILTVE